ncbi:efflux RND transporter periplasmic adaptor subunit [Myxococcus sp. RHSTA-1-4]|uniref:efflux RND transporter periplasmic adaptor subunit n=1 Tax=Myxococcus sp. RHSTA-1-4 TaxID=2874601 RepID=UPI001CBEDA6B|nr:efflux RND transporter periplasmic adaptor subunit [Myxococcus sp. RHSTA-1-4]MBZ4416819.1 efflux RND transporter periplasmic adaptor subunit [Myxococcus sp. RHSTA-1-4]
MRHVLLTTALLLGAGCSSPPAEAPAAAPSRPSSATEWVRPRPVRGVPLAEAPARVLPPPDGAAAIGVPLRASVSRIAVRPGQGVRRGDVLLEVRMPEVVEAAGRIQAASLRREAYAKRREQLMALKEAGMARLAELTEAETQLAEAEADAQAARAMLAVAGVDPKEAAAVARSGVVPLRSPVEGTVTEVSVVLGETRDGAGAPMVRVAGGGEARIEARFARVLPEEARFEFTVPGTPPVPVREVSRSPAVDPGDGSTTVWFEPETPRQLPAGLAGAVRVRADGLPGVTVVPVRALLLEAGQAEVLVQQGRDFRRQRVEVVATSGADALVRGPGEADVVAADAEALLLQEAAVGGGGQEGSK